MSFFDRALPLEEPPVRLAREDPDLFAELPQRAWRDAHASAIVPALRLDAGRWNGTVPGTDDFTGHLGLLLVEGLLVRTVVVGRQARSEVLGPGDLFRPWERDDEDSSTPVQTRWTVAESARIAVLDPAFLNWSCQWPTIMSTLVGRLLRRSTSLALQLAITDGRRVDERLLLLLWHLADRWGRVRPDGVLVPLRVTHDTLAELAGAQRPTVTSALARLTHAGHLKRLPDRTWLLNPSAAEPGTAASPLAPTSIGSAA